MKLTYIVVKSVSVIAMLNNKQDKKITLKVMIDGGKTFSSDFVIKQKFQVVLNKTLEHFNLSDMQNRIVKRGDETPLSDYTLTLEEIGLRDNETIYFILKSAPKPDEPKKFA